MDSRIKVYMPRLGVVSGRILTKTIGYNEQLSVGCYWSEADALNAYNDKQLLLANEYKKNQLLADNIFNKLEVGIKDLLRASNCELDFTYEGDSHGIYEESLEISTVINNRMYTKKISF